VAQGDKGWRGLVVRASLTRWCWWFDSTDPLHKDSP
jgi:hypothetical protein